MRKYKKVAIHIHIYYIDIYLLYVSILNNINENYDLYLTTDTLEKKAEIQRINENTIVEIRCKEIYVFENIGRDILPWLKIKDVLNTYDVVGHFHTKKTPIHDEWMGKSWLESIIKSILKPYKKIIYEFNKNDNLGIIIPDLPPYFVMCPAISNTDNIIYSKMESLWKLMECNKYFNFKEQDILIFPYGNMFWYRPLALVNLFNLDFSSLNIPPEPINDDYTILHVIERIIVYCALNNNYDYKIFSYKLFGNYLMKNNLHKNIYNKFIFNLKYKKNINNF